MVKVKDIVVGKDNLKISIEVMHHIVSDLSGLLVHAVLADHSVVDHQPT